MWWQILFRVIAILCVTCVHMLFVPSLTRCGVYNVHLYTDSSPDLTDRESFLASVLPAWKTSQDSAAAVWRHLTRLKRQAPPTFEGGRGIWDPIYFLNSYGSTECGYVSSYLQSLWEGCGPLWRSTYVELGGHTVAEVSWDQGLTWHMFDASMNYYCLNHSGSVASVTEISAAEYCPLSEALGGEGGEPGHAYLYHGGPGTFTNPVNAGHAGILDAWGHRSGTDNPLPNSRTLRNGADPFIDGFSRQVDYTHARHGWAHRLHLRKGDSYTRYWHSLGSDPEHFRPDITGNNPDLYDATHIPGGNLRSNGVWVFRPGLGSPDYRKSIYSERGVSHRSESGVAGPAVHAAEPGVSGSLTFKVYPANVATSGSVRIDGRRESSGDSLLLEVSINGGQSWVRAGSVETLGWFSQEFPLAPASVGGAMEFLVRVVCFATNLPEDCGLDQIEIRTLTQVNPRGLPRLRVGDNRVRFFLGPQEESDVLWPVLHQADHGSPHGAAPELTEHVVAAAEPDVFYEATVRPEQEIVPGRITWLFTTPRPILGVRYGGMFHNRYSSEVDKVDLSHSFGDGQFTLDGRFDGARLPQLNGRLMVSAVPPDSEQRSVRFRLELSCRHPAAYNSTGIQDLLFHVAYEAADAIFEPIDVTYCWIEHRREGDFQRTYRHRVTNPDEVWDVPVGGYRDPTMLWLRTELSGDAQEGESPPYGFGDALSHYVEGDHDRRVYSADWLDNVAWHKPYQVSRAANPLNGDSGLELTNGGIIAPTNYPDALADELTALWSPGLPVEVTIDLEQPVQVQGICVHTHQPVAPYAHPDSIEIFVSADGLEYDKVGTVFHDAVWNPPGDMLDFEMFDSSLFDDLPARGRLAFPFWFITGPQVEARYLRCRFHARPGCGLSLSEIQAFRSVQVLDWPDREVHVPGVPVSAASSGGVSKRSRSTRIAVMPNPAVGNVRLVIAGADDPPIEFLIVDVGGRLVKDLGVGRREGEQFAVEWDGRDSNNRKVAAGIYLCVVRTLTARHVARVVIV